MGLFRCRGNFEESKVSQLGERAGSSGVRLIRKKRRRGHFREVAARRFWVCGAIGSSAMVMSSRRTYADAVAWIKRGRPDDLDRRIALAFRIFGACCATGIVGWGIGAYLSPASFGQPGAKVLSLGWPTAVYAALVVVSAIALILSRNRIRWVVARVREPYERTLSEHPSYEGAVNALASCARPLQLRFALGWTWGPMLIVIVAAVFAFSAAYLCIYAVLAGFDVGLQTYAIAAADVLAGVTLLSVAAGRLSTWRVATSVYRSVILM